MDSRRGMRALLALVPILLAASPVAGQDDGVLLPVDEEEILILEVRAERYLASSGLIGYRHADSVLLPLGELAAVLEYAIIAYPDRGEVEGWLVEEERDFFLDVQNRSVTIAGRQSGVPAGSLYVNGDDVYVTAELLEQWWPIELEIDLAGLRVEISALETVPLIARLNREARWAQLGRDDPAAPPYPRREADYRLAAWPFLDATVSVDGREHREPTWRGSILSRGDLARLSVTGFLGYDNQAPNAWRGWLRAGRTDRDAELLGPLASTAFTVGDVVSTPLPLIDGATRGRGLELTNRPLGSVSQFDAVDIAGDAPPGWEVELYLDGALYALQTADGAGHYFFSQVPLHLGLNTIRAVLYGPNGQTREDVRTYNIRSGMWRRGHLNYNYSGLQIGESILGLPTTAARVPGEGEWDHRLELGYGLSHTTTVTGAYSQNYVDDGLRRYVQGRLLQSLGPLFLQGVAVQDLEAGSALSLSAQTLLGRKTLFLGWSEFSDYHSNTNEGYGDLARRLEARLSGAVRGEGRNLLGYRLKWQREKAPAELDQRRDFLDLYLSTSLARVSVSHNARYLRESGTLEREELLGNLRLAGYLAGLRVSGEMEYDALHGEGVRSLGLIASRHFSDRITGQLTGRRSFLGTGSTFIQAQFDWHLRPVRLGLHGGYETFNGNFIGVSATTSLVRPPESGGWVLSNRSLSSYGAALVRAFVDHDGDGVYGGGDEALAEVGFGRNPLWQDVRTAEDGLVFLPGITADQFVNVKVDPATVEDPYLVPAFAAMTTVVHSGGIARLDFPFHYVGEIEGLVARDAALTRPLRNIGLELLDLSGERVATTVSEFDGFYLFQNVLPGDYLINVVRSTLRGDHYIVPEPQPVTVPPGGDYVPGPPIILRGVHDEPPVVVAAAEEAEEAEEAEAAAEAAAEELADATAAVDEAGGGSIATENEDIATVATPSATPTAEPAGGVDAALEVAMAEAVDATAEGATPADSPREGAKTPAPSEPAESAATQTAPAPAATAQTGAVPPATPPASAAPATTITPPPSTGASATPAGDPAATVPADQVRSLHLIHELLFASSLFAGDAR